MKRPTLGNVELGSRVKLADGRVVVVTGPTKGGVKKFHEYRWVCPYLGEYEWLPGKWGARLGQLEILKGDQEVEKV